MYGTSTHRPGMSTDGARIYSDGLACVHSHGKRTGFLVVRAYVRSDFVVTFPPEYEGVAP